MANEPAPATRPPDRGLPIRVYRLGEEHGDDLSALTTAEERVAMVWELSARMWELSGRTRSDYTRATTPVVVARLHD
jgi:hypothetical protein